MLLSLSLCTTMTLRAQSNDSIVVAPDSSNFVTASVLIISPTNAVYSVSGHSALRMECPSHQLDYVFTFESDPSVSGFITFFAGKAEAKFLAVPTDVFFQGAKLTGRGIKQYELNLTHHEKQELWRHLDEDMVKGAHRKFNMLINNCVSMTVLKLRQSCIDERLELTENRNMMVLNNGDYVRQYIHRSPWSEFIFFTFMSSLCDEYSDYETRLCPENLIGELKKASFVSEHNQEKRPVLTGKEKELLTETYVPRKTILTPMLVFGFLLLLTCFLTYAEWRWQWIKPARCFDSMLLTIQSLIGLVLLYITFVSELLGCHFNWYLIPFNPLPLILWLCLRKQKNYSRVYLLYTVVLVAFIALTPFLSQLDVPHQMITMVLAVRCGSKYIHFN